MKNSATSVATLCGVSRMTVSRVLRGLPGVAPQTRERVLRTAERLGVRLPTAASRPVETPKTYHVLFQQAYSLNDAYFSEIVLSIQRALAEAGWGCAFTTMGGRFSDVVGLNRYLREQHVAGVIVVGKPSREAERCLLQRFPHLVFVDFPGDPETHRPYNSVSVDNVHGAGLALKHLLALGRERILLISGSPDHYFSNALEQAYTQAHRRAGMDPDPSLIVRGDFHVESGRQAIQRALADGTAFDAAFTNDEMACGAARALAKAGMSIPADVSLVGYDGLPIGELLDPPLTTVYVDRQRLGRLAVKRLLGAENARSAAESFEKTLVFPELIVRGSCGGKAELPAIEPSGAGMDSRE